MENKYEANNRNRDRNGPGKDHSSSQAEEFINELDQSGVSPNESKNKKSTPTSSPGEA